MISYKEQRKLDDTIAKVKVTCKNCGHTMPMPDADRTICSWCQKWVYKTPEIEFRYNLKKELSKKGKK